MQEQNNKNRIKPPPVVTGHDDRAEERKEKEAYRRSEAPDGISGNWS